MRVSAVNDYGGYVNLMRYRVELKFSGLRYEERCSVDLVALYANLQDGDDYTTDKLIVSAKDGNIIFFRLKMPVGRENLDLLMVKREDLFRILGQICPGVGDLKVWREDLEDVNMKM